MAKVLDAPPPAAIIPGQQSRYTVCPRMKDI